MDMLEVWQDIVDEVERSHHDARAMKAAKSRLGSHLHAVHEAMRPLLTPEFLNSPNDEEEHRELEEIRNHYLPECIFAWNSVLYYAGHSLSRINLVSCMDLAQIVAQNKSLTDAFVASKRMKELVTQFALDSQALLQANESGGGIKPGGKRPVGGGKVRPDIWQVSWKSLLRVDRRRQLNACAAKTPFCCC